MMPEEASKVAAGMIAKPGNETSEFSLAKLQTYAGLVVGFIFALAAFFQSHEAVVSTAEKVAPDAISEVLSAVVPMVIALAGFLKAHAAHVVYSNGRVDFKDSALKFLADAARGASVAVAKDGKVADGFENAIAGDAEARAAKDGDAAMLEALRALKEKGVADAKP